jgi:hypothetical protein
MRGGHQSALILVTAGTDTPLIRPSGTFSHGGEKAKDPPPRGARNKSYPRTPNPGA